MAGPAGGGAFRIVGGTEMATRTYRVARAGGRLRFVGVACRAGRRRRRRGVRRGRVTARALGVARALRELDLVGVALRAHRDHRDRLAGMMGMAVEALRSRVTAPGVAGLACERFCGMQARRVDRMATDASNPGARRRMTDVDAMTRHARTRCIGVRLMAIGTPRVRERCEHRLIAMTGRARLSLGDAELMRHVTPGALDVAGRDRRALLPVTGRATRIGRAVGLVHVVAIETAARPGVLGLLIGVALRARLRIEARRAVGVMALAARLIVVRTDGMRGELRLVVTPHAVVRRDRLVRAEAVTVLTRGLMNLRMQRRLHAYMALRAQRCRRWGEAGVTVACGARDLADVNRVSRARAHELIRRRDLVRNGLASTPTADQEQDQQPSHGREPIV